MTAFLNVDFDLESSADLQPLITAFGRRVIVLQAGRERRRFVAHLELASAPKTADQAIRRFVKLIEGLPESERQIWDVASVRDFNIGVEAGHEPRAFEIALEAATVTAASSVNARIVLTVYAPDAEANAADP